MTDTTNPDLLSIGWNKFTTNFTNNFTTAQGGTANAVSGVIIGTNLLIGSSPVGRFTQTFRDLYSTAVSLATGTTPPNISEVKNENH